MQNVKVMAGSVLSARYSRVLIMNSGVQLKTYSHWVLFQGSYYLARLRDRERYSKRQTKINVD